MPSAFSYPERPWDRVLAGAGQIERLARAAGRALRNPESLRQAQGSRSISPFLAPAPAEGDKAPLLYLPAVSWTYRFQRPQQLALALARCGHPVLYVDGFLRSRLLPARQIVHAEGGLHVLRVRVPGRPDPYREPLDARAAARLADVVLAGLAGRPPGAVLVQLPFWAALGRELARRLDVPLVYDRIDLHAGFPGIPASIGQTERELLRDADRVCATAALLADEPRALHRPVELLRNGVDLSAFPGPLPLRQEGPVRIGYVGALGSWFDVPALSHAAGVFKDWQFVLAGRVEDPEVAALSIHPHLETPGEIPFAAVPGFLSRLDVALVAFRDLPLTRAVDPVKLYEALALGLPVVARRLPETERWPEPLVYLYDDPVSFERQLRRAVGERTAALALARRKAAEAESWDHRAADLISFISKDLRSFDEL